MGQGGVSKAGWRFLKMRARPEPAGPRVFGTLTWTAVG